jgi:hypothetical protein
MNGQIIVIDDVLPESYADSIEGTLFSPTFPWFYTDDITYEIGSREELQSMTFGFFHLLFSEGRQHSNFFSYFEPIVHIALDKTIKLKNPYVLQARSFMQFPIKNKKEYNNKHIDTRTPHFVVLYYVNDSDGDTFLFEGTDIRQRISPKKNRVVIFDGSIYHASSNPDTNKRAVINFNVCGEYNG